MPSVFHIDPVRGSADSDGLDPARPRASHAGLSPAPGDAVLFRRGTVLRAAIDSPDGASGAPVFWGAYGEGPAPRLLGSVSASRTDDWTPAGDGLWRCVLPPASEVCNVVFDGGTSCGVMAWTPEELRSSGEGSWLDEAAFSRGVRPDGAHLLLRSAANPAEAHPRGIELCLHGAGALARARRHVRFEGLSFECAGCHGFQGFGAEDVVIRDCSFRHVGGTPWHRGSRIRYGNAVEFWDGARDCEVAGCRFDEIFDSCITTQGPHGRCGDFRSLVFHGNRMRRYGMAALEIRDTVPCGLSFRGNDCDEAGLGFSLQGANPPRLSEIWPEPMGHHVFAWRLDAPAPDGSVAIDDNLFGPHLLGSAFFAHDAAPAALAQVRIPTEPSSAAPNP